VVSTDVSAQDGTTLGLAVGPQAMVTTWPNDSGEILLAFRQSLGDGQTIWNGPVTVSNSLQNASFHPQVALGSDGQAHVIWSEDGEIWFNRCRNSACEEPFSLTRGEQGCTTGSTQAKNDWPTLAIAEDGTLMAAWQTGEFAAGYTTWEATQGPESRVTGCVTSDLASPRPRLSVGKPGEFWMVLSGAQDAPGNVSLVRFNQGEWETPQAVGEGSSAEAFTNRDGDLHAAWCGLNQELNYRFANNSTELITSSACRNRPSIYEDTSGRIHLVYATDQWQDNFGTPRNGNALMETIRLSAGWSEPALVGPLFSDVQQEAAGSMGSDIQLAWIDTQDESLALRHSIQPVYQCDEGSLFGPIKIVLDVVMNGEFHPTDYQSPFCGNQFKGFVFMPNPDPEFYVLPPGERTGYDQLADIIMTTRYEILFSNMQWDQDENNLSPGTEMAKAVTELYQQVKANPEAYPRGLTIKILLGNYPSMATLENGDQIWNVVQDFADMGLPTMEDPAIGWKVELANYKGSMPHSHTKFIVIDGKTIMAAGFNIAWLHLPAENPSGKGDDLTDLGIVLTGPVAQTGIAAFDDQWIDSNQLMCNDLYQGDLRQLLNNCTW
jgi:hypothetical protein